MYSIKCLEQDRRFVIENDTGLQWYEKDNSWIDAGTTYWDVEVARKQLRILKLTDQVAALKDAVETRDEELQAAISERDKAKTWARLLIKALQEFAEKAQAAGMVCAIPVVLGPSWLLEENA